MNRKFASRFFVFFAILALFACEDREIYPEESMFPPGVTNRYALLLQEQLEDEGNVREAFQEVLAGDEPRYDLVRIVTCSDFGLCYHVPFGERGGSGVTGAVYLPIGASLGEEGEASFDGTLGNPVRITAREIDHEVGLTQRFLYSVPFRKLQEQGVKVDPELVVYADLLDGKVIPLSLEDMSSENISLSRSSDDAVEITIYYSASYIGGRTDAVIGLSPDGMKRIVYGALRQMRINNIDPEGIRHELYQKIHLTLMFSQISGELQPFLDSFMRCISSQGFYEGFDLSVQYTYEVRSKSTGGGGGTGGSSGSSSGGGTSTGGGSLSSPERDTSCQSRNIQKMVPRLWMRLDSIQAAVVGTNQYITFEDYLAEVSKDPSVEHSTTLIDYGDGQLYLTEVKHGTENGVSNNITSAYVSEEIHNHPNGTPPSAQDLLFTAEMVQNKQNYQATFVYNHEDGSYYSLYVEDSQKACTLFDKLENEVDPRTNDFREDGNLQYILENANECFANLSGEQRQIYRLCSVIAECGGGVVVTKYQPSSERTEVYGVRIESKKNGEKNYKPLICQ